MADGTYSELAIGHTTAVGAARYKRSRNKIITKSGQASYLGGYPKSGNCIICGIFDCAVTSHRITTVQFLKRIAKASKKTSKGRLDDPSHNVSCSPTVVPEHPQIAKLPSVSENIIDPFTVFPVQGASKEVMRQFHDFFTNQGGFVTDNRRKLVFDQRGFAYLYPAAMHNSALCMSVVALASTYNAVHFRERAAPDTETLSIFNQAFQLIREQIEDTKSPEAIEYTVHAVHRLAMACGIGFGDPDASVTHWNGILALLDKYPHLRSSGRVMGYITQVEYWVAMNPGVKPKSEEWPVLLPHEKPPPRKYGEGFPELLGQSAVQNEVVSKLLSIALTSCRATELLEAEVSSLEKFASRQRAMTTASPYFMHVFDVLLRQQAQLYTTLMDRNDIFECVSITLNIYLMIVLRCTPWRAPVEHLCVRLQNSLTACETSIESSNSPSDSSTASLSVELEDIASLNDLYLWMLIVCACALELCRSRSCQRWAHSSIRMICRDELSLADESGQAEILCRMRRFCWSDTFLSARFEQLCSELR